MKSKPVKAKVKAKPKAKKVILREKIKREALAPEKKPVFFGLHNLPAPKGARMKKRILGRGPSSGHGKTSSRGSKGETSRSGRDFYLGFEGGTSPLIRRIPKRGFVHKFKKEYQVVHLAALDKIKEPLINPELLEIKGLIKDKTKLVKILSDGEIKYPLIAQVHAVSKKAAEKIKNAGGKIELIHA